jgi:hypothetical protein
MALANGNMTSFAASQNVALYSHIPFGKKIQNTIHLELQLHPNYDI